jgi:hypothetical protein
MTNYQPLRILTGGLGDKNDTLNIKYRQIHQNKENKKHLNNSLQYNPLIFNSYHRGK